MRIIFLNRFYWPEEPATAQLLTDLAQALAAGGRDVTVITSRPAWLGLPRREVHAGVQILRVAGTRWGRFGIAGKAADFLTFYLAALVQLAFTAQRGDAVVALTDPPLIGIGAWLVGRTCGARIFLWVQDIYPEIAVELTGQRWPQIIAPLRNLAWRRADGCVTLGSDMAFTLAQAGVPASKIRICPNWAPSGLALPSAEDVDALRTAWQLQGKFVVAYSGNLGRVHDLGPVLEVAAALRDERDIAFIFIGGGAQRAPLEAQATASQLENVHFYPAQPRRELSAALAVGDLHWVTLRPGCERLVFPSKLYGVAALSRPVFFIGPHDCEIAQLITARGIGHAFVRTEISAIASAIRELRANAGLQNQMKVAAGAFGREHSGPNRAVAAWDELVAVTA